MKKVIKMKACKNIVVDMLQSLTLLNQLKDISCKGRFPLKRHDENEFFKHVISYLKRNQSCDLRFN